MRKKVLNTTTKLAGSNNSTEPRHIKEIIDEILQSELLFETVFPNTELGIDLKLLTRERGRIDVGAYLAGILVHDGDYHFTFVENAPESEHAESANAAKPDAPDAPVPTAAKPDSAVASDKKVTCVKRNPIVIPGNCVNLHRRADGSFYLTFRYPVLTQQYTWKHFCIEAAREILSLTGLVEKGKLKARP